MKTPKSSYYSLGLLECQRMSESAAPLKRRNVIRTVVLGILFLTTTALYYSSLFKFFTNSASTPQEFVHYKRDLQFDPPADPGFLRVPRLRHLVSHPKVSSISTANLTRMNAYTTSDDIKEVSQIALPAPTYGTPVTSQQLFEHEFANSYGYVLNAPYSPPSNSFNRVTLELHVTSLGVQYDRLSHLFLNDIPLWRPSTAEPSGLEIEWSVVKDVSDHLPLFEVQGTIKFELDNIIDTSTGINGVFNVTITAYYYDYQEQTNALLDEVKSDLFVFDGENVTDKLVVNNNYTKSSSSSSSLANNFSFSIGTTAPSKIFLMVTPSSSTGSPLLLLPDSNFTYSVPQLSSNTTRAKLLLFISGNGNEEFWYLNMLTPSTQTWPSVGFLGAGPVRVIKVYLDNELISVRLPPPVIYTGGIAPSLWSPTVGIGAFDVEPVEVDLSILLPKLTASSTIKVEVIAGKQTAGATNEETTTLENWICSGSLMVWEDSNVKQITGQVNTISSQPASQQITVNTPDSTSLDQTVGYEATVDCDSTLQVELYTGESQTYEFKSSQQVKFYNVQTYRASGSNSTCRSEISMVDELTCDGTTNSYSKTYLTVVNMNDTTTDNGSSEVIAVVVDQGSDRTRQLAGKKQYQWSEYQNGTALFVLKSSGNYGSGKTDTMVSLVEYDSGLSYHDSN